MKSYLNERTQTVYNNGFYSELLPIGNYSTIQGSCMASLLYIIYTLDQPLIGHIKCEHNNYQEYNECKNYLAISYIDDCLSIIIANNWNNLNKDIIFFLILMQQYHDSNKLVMNEDKTIMSINTRNKEHKK